MQCWNEIVWSGLNDAAYMTVGTVPCLCIIDAILAVE